jgi:uncharacterized protein (DUF433 family)
MTKLNNSAYNNGVNWHERIVSDESVLLGKPTVKGTRISIEFILERLADGWTEQQLLENYPRLTRDDLQAVFSYAADCLKDGLMFETDLSVK